MQATHSVRCQVASPLSRTSLHTSRRCSFAGSQMSVNRGSSVVVMMKKDIHPDYFEDSKVFCNGEEVMTVSGTQKEYNVDVWSGNHPFFQGDLGTKVVDDGRVNRFMRRFGGLDQLSDVTKIGGAAGKPPTKAEMMAMMGKKPKGKGKGKK